MADEISIVVRAQDSFSGVLGNFGNIMTGLKSTIDLVAGAFRSMGDIAMEGLNSIAFYERLTLSLTSLTAAQMVQAGTAKDMASAMDVAGLKAQELADWMQELAIKSPFTFEGVAQAFRLAEAYGFTAEQAQQLTKDLIDWSSATGMTEDSMRRVALVMGQVQTIGHLTGQDMLQFTQAGMPLAQVLADYYGVTTDKIIEMRTAGLIPAMDVYKALTEYIETNFAGAAEKQATSWAGLMSTFSDIKQMGLREFFTGMFDAIQPLTVEISNFLQGAGIDFLSQIGDIVGGLVANSQVLITATDAVKTFNEYYAASPEIIAAFGKTIRDLGADNPVLVDIGNSLLMVQSIFESI